MSQHCKSSQTETARINVKKSQHNVTPTRHENHVAQQKC